MKSNGYEWKAIGYKGRQRKARKKYEIYWLSMRIMQKEGKSLELYESKWKSMKSNGKQWKSMKLNENLWKSMKMNENL